MKIILKEDVANLGYKSDVIVVKNGYGRNYLIPKGKAIVATESAIKMLNEDLRQRAHKLAKIKADAEELSAKLNDASVTIAVKTSANGKIFGSVTSIQIVDALAKQGLEIDRKIITIDDAIKSVGTFTATARIHRDVKATINVIVEKED